MPKRIGLLGSGAATSVITAAQIAAIKEGLRDNGLIDGRDYVLDARFAAGRYERFPELARDQAGAGVILTNTIASVRAAQCRPCPSSCSRSMIRLERDSSPACEARQPYDGSLNEDLTPKLLEFFRACLPKAGSIAALFNPANPTNVKFVEDLHPRASAIVESW